MLSLRSAAAMAAGLALIVCGPAQAAGHPCAGEARAQAKRLLTFHFGEPDERIAVDEQVKVLPPLRRPGAPREQLDVLEVMGYVYKGNYRMRLLYLRAPAGCALAGQEILEL